MQDRTQLDNAVAYNAKQERKKAIIALEIAKKIDRPVIFLPRGFSLESQKLRAEKFRNKN